MYRMFQPPPLPIRQSVSLEYFHLYYRNFSIMSLEDRKSLEAELHRAKKISRQYPRDYVRMVLIDDQPVSKKERARFFTPIIARLHEVEVDFVTFELDLNIAKMEWLGMQDNDEELSHTIKKVYNGNLQCSHYIAIWYLMRLGLLRDQGCFIPVSKRAMDGFVSPVQPRLRVVLPESYRAVEEVTATEILDHNVHALILRDRVERVYHE